MVIEEKDIQLLEKYIPDIREVISSGNINMVLDEIDNMIIDDILEHDDEPSEIGSDLQLIYDRIQSKMRY